MTVSVNMDAAVEAMRLSLVSSSVLFLVSDGRCHVWDGPHPLTGTPKIINVGGEGIEIDVIGWVRQCHPKDLFYGGVYEVRIVETGTFAHRMSLFPQREPVL